MTPLKEHFISAVIGPDGSRALFKAIAQQPDLQWALVPNVILAWLEAVANAPYSEPLPGVSNIRLSFHKSETDAYTGRINIDDEVYDFAGVPLVHVAGSVAVALGVDQEKVPELKSPSLAKLHKSVELLVKSRTLRKMAGKHGGGAKGITLPGMVAKPIAPAAPVGAVVKQPDNLGKKPNPNNKSKKPTLRITKSQASTKCEACGDVQIVGGEFKGCVCYASLAKGIDTNQVEDGFVLTFREGVDHEAILAIADALGIYP